MNRRTFGETLRMLRERENLSVKTVIEELKKYGQNITDKTLYSYENGKRAANADMFLALCQIYNCDNILETFAGIELDYSIPDDYEWKLIEKYRALDSHGKDMVDTVLEKEHSRCLEIQNAKVTPFVKEASPDYLSANAAHERTDTDFTDEDRQADEDMLD